jgi:hypothetical protein
MRSGGRTLPLEASVRVVTERRLPQLKPFHAPGISRNNRPDRLMIKRATLGGHAWSAFKAVVDVFSAEWLVAKHEIPNGGSVVLLRTCFVTCFISAIMYTGSQVVFPGSGVEPLIKYILATFGGVYAALYTRYASQWTYLANIYHRIKETESRNNDHNVAKIAEWKAGFIEDVAELHLTCKPIFASVLVYWMREPQVWDVLEETSQGYPRRLGKLYARARLACVREMIRYQRESKSGSR